MPFGQQSGPPATSRQVRDLLALLNEAGHVDFRDARGPMGFTQRQAGGKFTRDEADEFIEQLTTAADEDDASGAPGGDVASTTRARRGPVTAAERTAAAQSRDIRNMPSELLAAELQRRGWAVIEP